jgi:hypothetical protein
MIGMRQVWANLRGPNCESGAFGEKSPMEEAALALSRQRLGLNGRSYGSDFHLFTQSVDTREDSDLLHHLPAMKFSDDFANRHYCADLFV